MKLSFPPMTRDELFDELACQNAELEKEIGKLESRLEREPEESYSFAMFDADLIKVKADFDLQEAAAWKALVA